MEPSNTQKEDLPTSFNGIKKSIKSILKSNQLFPQDCALLNGALGICSFQIECRNPYIYRITMWEIPFGG
ncbi:ATV_HP_G0014970.mRNA.1.CDS.1 [Saccharomyces cerevisiae]|nr:ATV_HP_G0014970.mRNA.1.CDS.1 [Saccharomyces cerevisiae]CAI6949932.1 ATV_HP_G0014970.mRNA.1.CDS.1 [Saccharomyces cerevisiae]